MVGLKWHQKHREAGENIEVSPSPSQDPEDNQTDMQHQPSHQLQKGTRPHTPTLHPHKAQFSTSSLSTPSYPSQPSTPSSISLSHSAHSNLPSVPSLSQPAQSSTPSLPTPPHSAHCNTISAAPLSHSTQRNTPSATTTTSHPAQSNTPSIPTLSHQAQSNSQSTPTRPHPAESNPPSPSTRPHQTQFNSEPTAAPSHSTQNNTEPAPTPSLPADTPSKLWKQRISGSHLLLPPFTSCLLLVTSLTAPCAAICPSNCTCDDEAFVVRCAPSNIDVLPLTFNPALQQLTMYGTEIHTLDINSFHWYQDLRHVNLSKNMIMKVHPETFRNQENLEELHLAENNISIIAADMFIGLSNLIVLSLRGNVIEYLEGRIFRHLKLLKDLDLSENRIHKLENDALAGLANLRVLHLQSNKLHAIPALNLKLVPDLAELSLGGNEFIWIQESDFQYMRTLKDLDLSGAMLEGVLFPESFRGLSGLRKLNLDHCGLKTVPSIPLSILGQLEELHIGQNLFVSLPTDVLQNNRNLQVLYISQCPNLHRIEKNVLEHNLHIKKIVITDNPELTYISPDALRFLPELRILDLRNNNLHRLSEHAASWTDIEQWHLEGNPVSCNCSAAWLHKLMLTRNFSGKVLCASPPSLAGVPLRSTQISELACGLDLPTQSLVIAMVVCCVVVVMAAVVVVMLYRHHNSCVHRLVKGHHQLGGQRGRCDLPYSHNYHQAYTMTSSNPVPVTEL